MNFIEVNTTEEISNVAIKMQVASTRFLIVKNQAKAVVGTISQGDIIRAILSDRVSLAMDIMNPNFLYLRDGDEPSIDFFKEKKVIFLPVLYSDNRLKEVLQIWDMI